MDFLVKPAASRTVMRFRSGLVLLALAFAGVSSRSTAQENPCLRRTVPVNVTTDDYQVISGLTPANFRGKYRGQPVDIVSVKCDTGPRRIVILLDASGSMHNFWEGEITAAQNLVSQAPMKDSFAILAFADRTDYTRIGFGQDRKSVVGRLRTLATLRKAKGMTAILDALIEAVNMLRPVKMGDAILLITDGEDQASRAHPKEVTSTLLATGVRPFALILADEESHTGRTPSDEVIGVKGFHGLIESVGGDGLSFVPGLPITSPYTSDRFLTRQDRQDMASAMSVLGREISEFYSVQVKLPEAVDKERDWQLEVVGDIPEKHHLRVVYPHRLAACQ